MKKTEKISVHPMYGMRQKEPMWRQWKQLHGRSGMETEADPEIWKEVWTKEERINNASTPMFLVEGVKKDA